MIDQASARAAQTEHGGVTCSHHWIIKAPLGPISRGVCRLCNEARQFKNYIEETPWDDEGVLSMPDEEPMDEVA